MYISVNTANRIKSLAKQKNIAIKDLLDGCGLNKNTLSSMKSRGSWIQANNLAKIADYLDCSVDYLLGRTNNPDINKWSTLCCICNTKGNKDNTIIAWLKSDVNTFFWFLSDFVIIIQIWLLIFVRFNGGLYEYNSRTNFASC